MRSWFAVFGALFGVLVWRNRFLFSTPVHELGDAGANSIFIAQAKHFGLLVGNYSRLGFNHPGPAYLYVEAAGEWLFHDVLGLVPTPWNGQMLALYALNAATFATVFAVMRRWIPAWPALAAMMLFVAFQPAILTSAWMPFVYIPTFLLLIVATGSILARAKQPAAAPPGGGAGDLWLVALAGGMLIHGHAVFALFASVLMGAAFVTVLIRRSGSVRVWLPALGVLLLFASPIVANTLVNWPGEIGKYLYYGSSHSAGSRSLPQSLGYVYRYWWPVAPWWLGLPVVVAAAFFAIRIKEPFVRAGLWLGAVVSLLLIYYAYAGIDNVGEPYMGYFYWAVTLFVVAVLASRWHAFKPVVAIVCVLAIGLLVPGFRTSMHDDNPDVPATLTALGRHAGGRPIVFVTGEDGIGMELPGLVKWAARRGMRACVRDEKWAFIASREFICTADEASGGVPVRRWNIGPADPPREGELARIGRSAFCAAAA